MRRRRDLANQVQLAALPIEYLMYNHCLSKGYQQGLGCWTRFINMSKVVSDVLYMHNSVYGSRNA